MALIPASHPRAKSLLIRERLVDGFDDDWKNKNVNSISFEGTSHTPQNPSSFSGTMTIQNNEEDIKILMHIYCNWYSVNNNFHL